MKLRQSWLAWLLLGVVACARTGLYPGEPEGDDSGSGGTPSLTTPPGGGAVGGTPAPSPSATSGATATPTAGARPVPSERAPTCVVGPETCNGRDDDCDGVIDDLPAEPCAAGGFRFCVAGLLSECPKRCDVCVAGSTRVCQNAFCSFWGEQECAADGQGFGPCREASPPVECAGIAKKFQDSTQLEQCCLDNGYCCLDQFDVDGDGNRREMLGACGDVTCQ